MAEKHPDELELLSFAEDDLDASAREEVADHLVACRSCADQVRRLEAGRHALRAAPLLELPGGRRETILASLPDRRDPWRFLGPVKRAVVTAAPVAAAAVLVGVFVIGGMQLGGGGDDDAGGGEAAEVSAADEGGGAKTREGEDDQATEEALDALKGARFVLSVQGPASAVVRALENAGITAEVDADGRVIAEGRAGEVTAVLADRPAGGVSVYVR